MVIRWDSESDWKNSQDSSGAVGRNGNLKQGYSRERPDLSTDLVGYWPLHDKNATDYSGNNNHGSLNGGLTTGVAGKAGLKAMSFDGSDDFVEMSDSINESYISISAWVKWDGSNSNQNWRLVSGRNTESFALLHDGGWSELSGYRGMVMTVSVGGTTYFAEEPKEMNSNKWQHYVGVYDGETVYLFRDGESVAENTSPSGSIDSTTDPVTLGHELNQREYFPGYLTDVRVYDRALSPEEIQELYEWGDRDFARPADENDGGVAYYPLDGNADDQWGANDANANALDFVKGVKNQGIFFDSTEDDLVIPHSNELDSPSQFTLSGFVRMDAVNTSDYKCFIWNKNDALAITTGGSDGSGTPLIRANNGNFKKYFSNSRELKPGELYHVAFVWNGKDVKFYCNGVLEDQITMDISINSNSADIEIGGGEYPDWNFNGLIDELRYYNSVLNAEEIFELYRYGTRGRDMRKQLVNY